MALETSIAAKDLKIAQLEEQHQTHFRTLQEIIYALTDIDNIYRNKPQYPSIKSRVELIAEALGGWEAVVEGRGED